MDKPVRHPSRRNRTQSKRADTWWLSRFKEHPFKAASLSVLVVGGLMLLVFFGHVGSMPELDLAGATATLAAVAVIGLLVSFALAGSVLAGGLMFRGLDTGKPFMRSAWTFAALCATGVFTVFLMIIKWHWKLDWPPESLSLYLPFCLCASFVCVRLWFAKRRGEIESPNGTTFSRWLVWGGRAIQLFGVGYIWIIVAALAAATFWAVSSNKWDDQSGFLWRLACWVTICYVINIFVSVLPKRNEAIAIVAMGAGGVAILLALSNNGAGIPVAAVRLLGLGEVPVGLVISARGCEVLNEATHGRKVCEVMPGKSLALACPALLRSRIGSPFIVEFSAFDSDDRWPGRGKNRQVASIPIAKNEILSWPAITPMAVTNRSADSLHEESPGPIVTYLDQQGMSAVRQKWIRQQCGDLPSVAAPASGPASSASAVVRSSTFPAASPSLNQIRSNNSSH